MPRPSTEEIARLWERAAVRAEGVDLEEYEDAWETTPGAVCHRIGVAPSGSDGCGWPSVEWSEEVR